MSSLSQSFIRDKFADYYKQHSASILPPSSLERREFGFLLLEKRVMLRHKGFRDVDDLRSSLCTIVPSDVYYSSAYYERPEEEMKEKGWLGADLIFDIDADHIPTPCATVHDIWVCTDCGASGKGVSPQKCPSCGGIKFKEKSWPCETCLRAAKAEAIKLIDVLTEDFGFSSNVLTVAFSGHRGYHVHVENEAVRGLDSLARKEIVDYVMGIGLEAKCHGLGKSATRERRVSGPDLNDRGWRGRVAKGTYDLLLTASKEDLMKTGLKTIHVKSLLKHREAILKSWKEKGPWGAVENIGKETWKKIAQYGVEKESVKIDTVVTPDINRLIRLSNSLHGKTGLKKIEFPITHIEDFDPLKSAVAFKGGAVTVLVSEAPQFRVEDEIYGPFERQKVELPTAAALMLLCKGVAKVVQ
ncbi:MAG: DNA primase small subunit PriS [Candidatus Bathyarchaeota archaeon]|nr:DNA primase small subunit PriS [Candidatus Bathyarchaeota archaeon]